MGWHCWLPSQLVAFDLSRLDSTLIVLLIGVTVTLLGIRICVAQWSSLRLPSGCAWSLCIYLTKGGPWMIFLLRCLPGIVLAAVSPEPASHYCPW